MQRNRLPAKNPKKTADKSAARSRWEILRLQVLQGFFKNKQREGVDLSDFSASVTNLWEDVYKYSGIPMPVATADISRKAKRRDGITFIAKVKIAKENTKMARDPKKRVLGLDELSFDKIPNCDVNDSLFAISRGFSKPLDVNMTPNAATRAEMNRGWKLMLIGLTQAESFARYESLMDISRALPQLEKTLTVEEYINELGELLILVSASDERRENRLKALYLVGQFANAAPNTEFDVSKIMLKLFTLIAKQCLENLNDLKNDESPLHDDIRLHLYGALANFVNFSTDEKYDNLILYIISEELDFIFFKQDELNANNPDLFVVLAILKLINNHIPISNSNISFIGALFKDHIDKILKIDHNELRREAISFIRNWLPIFNEDALLIGLGRLEAGLICSRELNCRNFEEKKYNAQLKDLKYKAHSEESRVSVRKKIINELLYPEGTYAKLYPLPGFARYFGNLKCSMRNTAAIIVELPINFESNVTISRPIPSIPGVPAGVTTTPPLFMVGDKWNEPRAAPRSEFEFKERIGTSNTIPPGFTHFPYVTSFNGRVVEPKDNPLERYLVPKEMTTWRDSDEIPKGAFKSPTTEDAISSACPTGFTLLCPYPGFDIEKLKDVSANRISPIYGKPILNRGANGKIANQVQLKDNRIHYQEYSTFTSLEAGITSLECPEHTTVNRHPTLFPAKLPSLRSFEIESDFIIGAPVLFEIIESHLPRLRRILTIVENVNEDICNIPVHRGDNDVYKMLISGGLYKGARFTMNIKGRSNPTSWVSVQLRVLDENYEDGNDEFPETDALEGSGNLTSFRNFRSSLVLSAGQETSIIPIPANYTATGEPFFAPPVNLVPNPIGYNQSFMPYYGKAASSKPMQQGLTLKGSFYYSKDEKAAENNNRNNLAGYDNYGRPFFVPRGFTLPSPSGFTLDGIPFYDIPSLIKQAGTMALPALLRGDYRSANDSDSWEELPIFLQNRMVDNPLSQKRLEKFFQQKLLNSVSETNPLLYRSLLGATIENDVHELPTKNDSQLFAKNVQCIQDPIDIASFLRASLSFAHLQPQQLRLQLEPGKCEFHSSRTPTTKSIALRYKASRGDHSEREYFISVDPSNVFAIKQFKFNLQGEGVQEISLTYYPMAMKFKEVEGSLQVFDRYGRKLAYCKLIAIKKNFFKVLNQKLDFGWVLPKKEKEGHLFIENLAEHQVNIEIFPEATGEEVSLSPFIIKNSQVKLKPKETLQYPIIFKPGKPGNYTALFRLCGPGGEEILAHIVGTTDIPMAILPESELNSKLGNTILSMERTQLVRKINKNNGPEASQIKLSEGELRIKRQLDRCLVDLSFRKKFLNLDFGICPLEKEQATLSLTILNWGQIPLTCSLFAHDSAIQNPYLVRIAPKSASSFSVTLSYAKGAIKGVFSTILEVSCVDFETIPVTINAYVGQPCFIPSWEYMFFKPCRIGQQAVISTSLINECQYPLKLTLTGFEAQKNVEDRNVTFSSSMGFAQGDPITIAEFSLLTIQFKYFPKHVGIFSQTIGFEISLPSNVTVKAGVKNKNLTLIGICIQPLLSGKKGSMVDLDISNAYKVQPPTSLIVDWLNSWKNLKFIDIPAEIEASRSKEEFLKVPPDEIPDVTFKLESHVFEDPSDFNSSIPIVSAHNKGLLNHKVSFLASPGFQINPKNRDLEAREQLKLELHFLNGTIIPTQATYYGFITVLQIDESMIASSQVVRKGGPGFILAPVQNAEENGIVLNFGKVEITGEFNRSNIRFLALCNPFPSSFNWSLRFAPAVKASSAFEIKYIKGEVQRFSTFLIPITFSSEVSGLMETKFEVMMESNSNEIKPVRIGNVILKGHAVHTHLQGMPNQIDFGCTIVGHVASRKFNIMNDGTQELFITGISKAPFQVTPVKFSMPSKSAQTIEITFSPVEHKPCSGTILFYANQHLFSMGLTGLGGTATLKCEKYHEKPIDFGLQQDGTIIWEDIYLTNEGSIPLKLLAVNSNYPSLCIVQFKGIVSTIPAESKGFYIRKDFWRTVRRKIKIFTVLKTGSKVFNSKKYNNKNTKQTDSGFSKLVEVGKIEDYDSKVVTTAFPALSARSSYHIRLGYTIRYNSETSRDIYFAYKPLVGHDENTIENLIETTTIEMLGDVYLPLEIKPYSLSFGFLPAESHIEEYQPSNQAKQTYGVSKQNQSTDYSSTRIIRVINRSSVPQSIKLEKISPEFTIQDRIWYLMPTSIAEIFVEFHPPKQQTQYIGEAKFRHKHGAVAISLEGMGASAELVTDDMVDFGNIKINSQREKQLIIRNRGVLDTAVEIDLEQAGTDFWFEGDDPNEIECFITKGQYFSVKINCKSNNKFGASGAVVIKWKRVPGGRLERITVPIQLSIGYPEFKLDKPEIAFKVTYININKTLPLRFYNDGNAACHWKAITDCSTISLDKYNGIVEPGEASVLHCTYSPQEYETLESEINFITDAGEFNLVCSGVVGVPYLNFVPSSKHLDFGVVTVNHKHHLFLEVNNTGWEPIEFEALFTQMKRNSEVCNVDDFDFFFIEPGTGFLQPSQTVALKIVVIPREYAVTYQAECLIKTMLGEQHRITLEAVGGEARVKIAAPKRVPGKDSRKIATPSSATKRNNPETDGRDLTRDQGESIKFLMKNHIDNMYEVIAGLRAAEIEIEKNSERESEQQFTITKTSRPISENSKSTGGGRSRPNTRSKELMDQLSLMEKEVEAEISMVDTQGLLSWSKPASINSNLFEKDSLMKPPSSKNSSLFDRDSLIRRKNSALFERDLPSKPSSSQISGLFDQDGLIPTPPKDSSSSSSRSSYTPGRRLRRITGFSSSSSRGDSPNSVLPNQIVANQENSLSAVKTAKTNFEELLESTKIVNNEIISKSKNVSELHNTAAGDLYSASHIKVGEKKSNGIGQLNSIPASELKAFAIGDVNVASFTESIAAKGGELIHPSNVEITGIPIGEVNPVVDELNALKSTRNAIVASIQEFELSGANIKSAISLCSNNTKSAITAVKNTLGTQSWIPNRDFISNALRKLQITSIALDNAIAEEPIGEQNDGEIMNYDLGVVCGGDNTPSVLLFSLPNEGNLEFEYKIVPTDQEIQYPKDVSFNSSFFNIENSAGILKPGEVLDIQVTFTANTSGSYKQSYILRSGDEDLIQFTLTGKVGNPILSFNQDAVFFGIVPKGLTSSQNVLLQNTGTYEGIWSLVNDGDSNSLLSFHVSPDSGRIEIGGKELIAVSFTPRNNAQLQTVFKLNWKGPALFLEASGTGGFTKLDVSFVAAEDMKLNGINFGQCFIDSEYRKEFMLKNSGNQLFNIELEHDKKEIFFDRNSERVTFISLKPGEKITLAIIYRPEMAETLEGNVRIRIEGSRNIINSFPTKAITLLESWKIDGQVDFGNCVVGELNQKYLWVHNDGTAPFQLEGKLDLGSNDEIVQLQYANWDNQPIVNPGQIVEISLRSFSEEKGEVDGELRLKAVFSSKIEESKHPINFKIFSENVSAEINTPFEMGRAAFGEKVVARQRIVNNSNKIFNYIAQIEGEDKINWEIQGGTAGTLNPNEFVDIEAIFVGNDKDDLSWKTAELVIGKQLASGAVDSWDEFSRVGLKAAIGVPEMVIYPDQLDFGDVAIGEEKEITISIHNPGSAAFKFTMKIEDDLLNIFKGNEISNQQIVLPEKYLELKWSFTPETEKDYETVLVFDTTIGMRELKCFGRGKQMKIDVQQLPEKIDFGCVVLGQYKEYQLPIVNASSVDFNLNINLSVNSSKFQCFYTEPPKTLRIINEKDIGDRNTLIVSCGMDLLLTPAGFLSPELIEFILENKIEGLLSLVNTIGDINVRIPLYFQPVAQNLILTDTETEFHNIPSKNTCVINFGEVPFDIGGTRMLSIHNENNFNVQVSLEMADDPDFETPNSSKQFKLIFESGIVPSNGTLNVEVILNPLEIQSEVEPPKFVPFKSLLIIKSELSLIETIVCPVSGVLSDIIGDLGLPEVINFGSCFINSSNDFEISIRNDSKRSFSWQITFEEGYTDVFKIEGPSNGVISSKQDQFYRFKFFPMIGTEYQSKVYILIDGNSYTVRLQGIGVKGELELNIENSNFGVVGISQPEYRSFSIFNPTILDIELRIKSDNPEFYITPHSILLPAGSTEVFQIVFVPSELSVKKSAVISFTQIIEISGKSMEIPIMPSIFHELEPNINFLTCSGSGGEFGFAVDKSMDSDITIEGNVDDKLLEIFAGLEKPELERKNYECSKMVVNFNEINSGKKYLKSFELVNSGASMLEFQAFNMEGNEIFDQVESKTSDQRLMFSISPSIIMLQASSKSSVVITIMGLQEGDSTFSFVLKTKNLMVNKLIQVVVMAKIHILSEYENLRTFLRAEDNLDTKYSLKYQEEKLVMTDSKLWKILYPILHISPLLPSQEYRKIPPIEPNVSRPDITSVLLRPAAIFEQQKPNKKWYTSRTMMGIERKVDILEYSEMSELEKRREDAIDFISNSKLEKNVQLEKRRE